MHRRSIKEEFLLNLDFANKDSKKLFRRSSVSTVHPLLAQAGLYLKAVLTQVIPSWMVGLIISNPLAPRGIASCLTVITWIELWVASVTY